MLPGACPEASNPQKTLTPSPIHTAPQKAENRSGPRYLWGEHPASPIHRETTTRPFYSEALAIHSSQKRATSRPVSLMWLQQNPFFGSHVAGLLPKRPKVWSGQLILETRVSWSGSVALIEPLPSMCKAQIQSLAPPPKKEK